MRLSVSIFAVLKLCFVGFSPVSKHQELPPGFVSGRSPRDPQNLACRSVPAKQTWKLICRRGVPVSSQGWKTCSTARASRAQYFHE
jgi:hypothetical protein